MVRGFNSYPYQNIEDLNLDYLLKVADEAKAVLEKLGDYEGRIAELEACCEAVRSGNFTPEMVDRIKQIVSENIVDIVGEMVKGVYFGLTMTGYFVAYIPESWDDITFNTTSFDMPDIAGVDFGHLVLSY